MYVGFFCKTKQKTFSEIQQFNNVLKDRTNLISFTERNPEFVILLLKKYWTYKSAAGFTKFSIHVCNSFIEHRWFGSRNVVVEM